MYKKMQIIQMRAHLLIKERERERENYHMFSLLFENNDFENLRKNADVFKKRPAKIQKKTKKNTEAKEARRRKVFIKRYEYTRRIEKTILTCHYLPRRWCSRVGYVRERSAATCADGGRRSCLSRPLPLPSP